MSLLDSFTPPSDDGQVAILPDADTLPDLARANAERRSRYRFRVMGVRADELAQQARAELLALAASYTRGLGVESGAGDPALLVATGHQPVLPHPGIWLKHHLAAKVARAVGGVSVNFIVDNDVVDLSRVAVPVCDAAGLRVETFALSEAPDGRAAEEIPAGHDAPARLATLIERARTAVGPSLCDVFLAAAQPAESLADFLAMPRRRLEERFGTQNLELPVGRLADTEAFRLFAQHLVEYAERFRAVYNAALHEHRERFAIRNPIEPTPDLRDGELPFWVWSPGGRRRPLLSEEAELDGADGLKLRPRALTMTLFFRLFCCDLFIHGMGGARYEILNDAVIRRFFEVEPPAFVAASATLRPRLCAPLPSPEDAAELRQTLRRMQSTPERFVAERMPDDAQAMQWAEQRRALLQADGLSRRERREAYTEAKKIAAQLRERMRPHILAVQTSLERAEADAARRDALQDRTFPCFLHSHAALEALYC